MNDKLVVMKTNLTREQVIDILDKNNVPWWKTPIGAVEQFDSEDNVGYIPVGSRVYSWELKKEFPMWLFCFLYTGDGGKIVINLTGSGWVEHLIEREGGKVI